MPVNDTTMPGSAPDQKPDRGAVVSSGWLGPQSVYGRPDDRKIGRAMATSLVLHGGLLVGLVVAFTVVPAQVLTQQEPVIYNVVYLKDPGPGGGGGGSPAPAPPRKVEIPKHKAPTPVPVAIPKPAEPLPTLVASIETTNAALLQASGTSSISLVPVGGGGRGGGVGSGQGNGIGEGTGGGFGGGAYAPGNGVTWPEVLIEVKPKYTPDAMRAKLMGAVELEIIVNEDGKVSNVRVTKSLDRPSGLDDAAMEAARKWVFKPGKKDGKPVPTRVGLVLEFRLH
jgi:protein TonB